MNRSIVMLALAGWALTAPAQETVDRRIDADPNGRLEISNMAGEITIEGWAENDIHVTGQLGPEVESLDVTTEGTTVIMRVVLQDERSRKNWGWSGEGTTLRIRAPRTMGLDVDVVSAEIDVRDMRAEQRLASVSGDIDTQAYAAEVRAQAVSGDVRITGRDEAILVRGSTVSGDVTIDNVNGDVSAESVSGDVLLRTGTINRARTQTVSGDVLVTTELGSAARLEGSAVSGDVEFLFSGDGAADYRLETFSGEIDNCFGPRLAEPDDDDHFGGPPPGKQLRFREGNTMARVEATTHSGDIEICRQ